MTSSRPSKFEDRYRLYLDESGDHVFRSTDDLSHRFLCLLGCCFRNPEYLQFHEALEKLKMELLPHHPDDPVVLHRADIMDARRAFSCLRDEARRAQFDNELLRVIAAAEFRVIAVVIDKKALRDAYRDLAAHPYHLGLGFLLQRFAGYLNHINRVGDVMAESRGGAEDRLLKDSYSRVYDRGLWGITDGETFQKALTSSQLKLKPKSANIAGLQLADLLGHPVKQFVLKENRIISSDLPLFSARLLKTVYDKFNRHLYDGRVEGYGYVLYPKK